MDKIVIVPERVRGLGNVLNEEKHIVFSNIFSEHTLIGKEVINGKEYEVHSLNYVNSLLYFTSYSVNTVVGYTETILGMVKDEYDDPVGSAEVSLLCDGEVLDTATSTSSGVVTFETTFPEGIHDLQLCYNNIKSGKVSVTCVNPDAILVDDVWITQGNKINISARVQYNSNSIPGIPVSVTIGETTSTLFTNNNGVLSFEYTGKGYASTIELESGECEQSVNVHDSIFCLHNGELMTGKNYAVRERSTGPGTGNAYMEWQGDVFKLTPTKESSTGTASYVNSKFYYQLLELEWIDDETMEVVDNDVGFSEAVVEFTYAGGTSNLPMNFYAWKNNDGTDPYFVLRYDASTKKYWSSCMQSGTIVHNRNISGSLKVNDRFKIIFDNGTATVYKNDVLLVTLTYDNQELHFGFLAPYNGSGMYKDFSIQTIPEPAHVVDSVTLATNKNSCTIGETVRLTATVLDEDDDPMEGVTVTFKNGNTTLGTGSTDSSGVAYIDYVTSNVGTLSVTATAGEVTSSAVSVTVNKLATAITLSRDTSPVYIGETFTLSGNLTSGGTGMSGVSVKLYDGDSLVDTLTTTSGGAFSTTITASSGNVGNHAYTAVYEGDSTHSNVTSAKAYVTVYKLQSTTTLSAASATVTVGGTISLSGTVSLGTSGLSVKIYQGNSLIDTVTTTSGGAFTKSVSATTAGNYVFTAVFEGDSTYESSQSSVNVTVSSPTMVLSIATDKSTYELDESVSVTGTLTYNGTGLSGKTIKLTDGSDVLASATTGSDGAYTISTTAYDLRSHNTGNTAVYVEFDGDSTYDNVSSQLVQLTIIKGTPTLTVSGGGTITQGSTAYLTGNLSTRLGAFSGRTVHLYNSNNVEVDYVETDSNGDYSLQLPTSTVGSFTYYVKYDATNSSRWNTVQSSNVSVSIVAPTPVPASVSLSSDKSILSYADSESCTLTATVLDSNDNPLEDVTVTFKKGTVTLGTDTTDASGEATYTYSSAGVGDIGFTAEVGSLVSETYSILDAKYYADNTRINSLLDSNGRAFINYTVERNDMVKFKFNTKPTHCLIGIGTSQSSCFVIEFSTSQTKIHRSSSGTSTYNSNWLDTHSEIGLEIVAVSASSDKGNVYFEGTYADYWGCKLQSNNNGLRVDKFTDDDYNIEIIVL